MVKDPRPQGRGPAGAFGSFGESPNLRILGSAKLGKASRFGDLGIRPGPGRAKCKMVKDPRPKGRGPPGAFGSFGESPNLRISGSAKLGKVWVGGTPVIYLRPAFLSSRLFA